MSRRICPICKKPCRWANRKKGRIHMPPNNGPNDGGRMTKEESWEQLMEARYAGNPFISVTNIYGETIPPHTPLSQVKNKK